MAVAARQGKPRKTGQEGNFSSQGNNNRNNRTAWRNSGTPTSFSPTMANQRLPGQQGQNPQQGFPPLAQGGPDKMATLAAQLGASIIITSRTGQRHEGTVTTVNPETDSAAGVILKDVKDLANPGGPLKETYFVPTTSIQSWIPAPAKPSNGTAAADSFRTDTDISSGAGGPVKRERELQAWQPDSQSVPPPSGFTARGDDATFGANASGESWDQFAANEQLFGVTAGFDEEVYTTKLDRNAPDFKERERKAQQLANEILGSSTNNSHIAEERLMNNSGGNDQNEEDKYGAVVRGTNAYVPPGARRNGAAPAVPATKTEIPKIVANAPDEPTAKPPTPASASGTPAADNLVGTFRDFVTNEKQRLTQKKEAIVKHEMNKRMADLVKFSKSFKLSQPIPEDLVPILTKDVNKQQQIREKSTKDAESSAARTIGAQGAIANPSSTRPSPLVQSPSSKDPASPPVVRPSVKTPAANTNSIKPPKPVAPPAPPARVPINMVIQKIPPFDPSKRLKNGAPPAAAATKPSPAAPAAARDGSSPVPPSSPSASSTPKLNINASSFKPNPNASSFKPGAPSTAASSPKVKPVENIAAAHTAPNPFFGTRVIKKGTPVHIKDDFNPFKFAKVAEASAVSSAWPYSGKRFLQLFPMPQPLQHAPIPQQQQQQQQQPQQQQQQQPPQPVPPPPYEEDSAQVAARSYGMVYAYAPYQYGQPQMMAVPAGGPQGGYMPSPYMQPMGYPHPGMPPGGPPGMYGPPPTMPGMPPPQGYPIPPGAYPPPPNGAPGPRGSMPPTPMPPHAYAYHHPSPQLGHAVPYQMMMPPPGAPPHGYDTGPGPGPPGPVPMGGH